MIIPGKAQVLKCSAYDRKLSGDPHLVYTSDGQQVFVESECYTLIERAGEAGYQVGISAGNRILLELPHEAGK
jgi:hypothetical protein